jgi:soluble lytic murein transglycosylase-like protein
VSARLVTAILVALAAPLAAAQDLSQFKLRGDFSDMKLRNPGEYRLRELRRHLQPDAEQRKAALAANPLLEGRPYRTPIARAAGRHDLDPALLHALITAESNYRADAVSPSGAIGLMQLMPETALRYGVRTDELYRPESNVRAGAHYLADLLKMFSGDLELALAGYNAGEWAVIRAGGRIPPFSATRAYVPKVLQIYNRLRPETAVAEGPLPSPSKL